MKYLSLILLVSLNVGCTRSSTEEKPIESIASKFIVDSLVLSSEVFHNTRHIRVLLPPDYFDCTSCRYPVLYMNDGIAVFHGYDLERVHELILSDKIIPLIIVGIDNGASTMESINPARDRANEYLPWPDEFETREDRLDNPKGELYPDFLINEVMPLVNENFRTKQGAQHTALGGSSYGALIALFTFTHHPDVFGSLLLESPSLYVANQQVLKESEKITRWPDYVYLGIGTAEGETAEIQKMAVDDAAKLASNINRNSGATKLKYFVDEGGTHDFDFFASRFPLALESLYSKGKSDF